MFFLIKRINIPTEFNMETFKNYDLGKKKVNIKLEVTHRDHFTYLIILRKKVS